MSSSLAAQLDAHCAQLAACRRCAIADPAVQPILSIARAPRAMLIGQAPGKTEVSNQRPFAGRAGKTLFRWLERAGFNEETFRSEVYISAITRCYPGPSPSGRGDRVPTLEEQGLCSEWLEQELAIIRPKVIIPVGRLAIDRIVGPGPLDAVVGRAHSVVHSAGKSIAIPLPHPSGASSWIHAPGHDLLLEQALGLIRKELGSGISRRKTARR